MPSLTEWEFSGKIKPLAEGARTLELATRMILDVAVPWAEERRYGVGGGPFEVMNWDFSPGAPETFGGFRFGLCATRKGQLIPEEDAQELFRRIKTFCAENGCRLEGSCGPYPSAVSSRGCAT